MPLNVPTKEELLRRIYLRLAGKSVSVTDMTTISAMRIFLEEAFIEEFMELYAGLVAELASWYLRSAVGDRLDRRLADYNFQRPVGVLASGQVQFTAEGAPAIVQVGILLRRIGDDAIRFKVLANPVPGSNGNWTVPENTTLSVDVVAVAVGEKYNVSARSIELVNSVPNLADGTTNTFAFINGRDAAMDSDALHAFWNYLLRTGANRASIQGAILNYVDPTTGLKPVHSIAFEEWQGNTLLSVGPDAVASIIHVEDGSGTATPELLDALTTLMEGNDTSESPGIRGAGLPVSIVSAHPFLVPVIVRVDILQAANPSAVQDGVVNVIQQFIGRLPISGSGLFGDQGDVHFAALFKAVVDAPGVLRAVFEFPITDINMPLGYKAMPGDITVSATPAR